jgi:poly(A) polymerase
VLYKLRDAGYAAYLVGGSVRDLLLGGKPKDFDVATDARPEKVRQLFRNCRLIGRRFRLAHVFFGKEIIEVATFRGAHPMEEHPDARRSDTGLLVRDNVYGDLEEDAWRRDFSVNALYYNIADFSVVDYTEGMPDLKNHTIRILGDPQIRYREDPVRILRAIRFAAKLNFVIEEATEAPILSLKTLLHDVPPARLFEEILKLFYCGHANRAFELLQHYGLLAILFPQTQHAISTHSQQESYCQLILQSCQNTDQRLRENLSLNPAFLFAVLLWPALQVKIEQLTEKGNKPYVAFEKAVNEVIYQQVKTVAVPKRYTAIVREIWSLQRVMEKRTHRKLDWVLTHPRFRAAYDFLLLRLNSGETSLETIVAKWTDLQIGKTIVATATPPAKKRRRKNKRRLQEPTPE